MDFVRFCQPSSCCPRLLEGSSCPPNLGYTNVGRDRRRMLARYVRPSARIVLQASVTKRRVCSRLQVTRTLDLRRSRQKLDGA